MIDHPSVSVVSLPSWSVQLPFLRSLSKRSCVRRPPTRSHSDVSGLSYDSDRPHSDSPFRKVDLVDHCQFVFRAGSGCLCICAPVSSVCVSPTHYNRLPCDFHTVFTVSFDVASSVSDLFGLLGYPPQVLTSTRSPFSSSFSNGRQFLSV